MKVSCTGLNCLSEPIVFALILYGLLAISICTLSFTWEVLDRKILITIFSSIFIFFVSGIGINYMFHLTGFEIDPWYILLSLLLLAITISNIYIIVFLDPIENEEILTSQRYLKEFQISLGSYLISALLTVVGLVAVFVKNRDSLTKTKTVFAICFLFNMLAFFLKIIYKLLRELSFRRRFTTDPVV